MVLDNTTTFFLISSSAMLMVIIILKLIYRHNPHVNKDYGSEIVLFHSDERYKKRIWRFNLIESCKCKQKPYEFQLKVVVGELSEDTLEIIEHAANENSGMITIIGGPKIFCEDKIEIYTLLDKYSNIKYSILPIRPNKHYMIFNNSHLYIEKPHRHTKTRGAIGIMQCKAHLFQMYDDAFYKMLKHSRALTKEDVIEQECYTI